MVDTTLHYVHQGDRVHVSDRKRSRSDSRSDGPTSLRSRLRLGPILDRDPDHLRGRPCRTEAECFELVRVSPFVNRLRMLLVQAPPSLHVFKEFRHVEGQTRELTWEGFASLRR
jgi:uncharacterized protein YecE (DUF72 family)